MDKNEHKQKIYNLSDVDERRKFFGIDANVLKSQEFSMKNKEEVVRFTELIQCYVEEETHLPFHWIDLPRWYDKCKTMDENGPRLFSAILDLKITFAFVFIDFNKTMPGFKALNSKESPNILTDVNTFKEKMALLHNNIDMAIRFRTFYDKFMGVLVLLLCPEKYKSYLKAHSRKEFFMNKMCGYIDSKLLDSIFSTISYLDDSYRTAEVHQTGRMRKWVLGGRDCFLDNAVELESFFNSILSLSDWLDSLICENEFKK